MHDLFIPLPTDFTIFHNRAPTCLHTFHPEEGESNSILAILLYYQSSTASSENEALIKSVSLPKVSGQIISTLKSTLK